MGFGLIAITGCLSYLAYMNYSHRNVGPESYIALNDDGTENLRPRKSRWD